VFGVALNSTLDPAACHPSGLSTVPPLPAEVSNQYSVLHCQVSVEFVVIVKTAVVLDPLAGTLPVPVHPALK
jgi:hypothetical protein